MGLHLYRSQHGEEYYWLTPAGDKDPARISQTPQLTNNLMTSDRAKDSAEEHHGRIIQSRRPAMLVQTTGI